MDLITEDDTAPVPSFDFEWRPRDLSVRGQWYNTRVSNLQNAYKNYPNSDKLFENGISWLDIHHTNYDEEGPNPTFSNSFGGSCPGNTGMNYEKASP